RRHTRSKRDWSSDVCSSDLTRTSRFGPHLGRSGLRLGAADAHTPALGPLFERIPGELAGLLGGELVVQRFGIVIVDEHERITDAEPVIGLEDQFVSTGGNLGAHIEFDVFGHGGSSFIRRGQIPSHYFHGITPCLLCHSPSTTCRRSRRPPASATDAVGPLRIRQSHGIAIAFALYGVDVISIDAAGGLALITYPLMGLIFGVLYGCTVSPCQPLCG